MQMKVLKVRYLESKKVLQNKCRLTRTESKVYILKIYFLYIYNVMKYRKSAVRPMLQYAKIISL